MEPALPPAPPTAPILSGEGEDRVLRILESITDGFCALDAEWRFNFINEAAKRLLAPHLDDPAALLGQSHWEALPETRGSNLEGEFRRAATEGVAVEFDYFHPPWKAWYTVRAFPIRGGGLSVYFRDVTAEKEAAAVLARSEERYRSLFNSMDEGFCVIQVLRDSSGRPIDYQFLETNAAFVNQTGLENVQGRRIREMVPNHDAFWFETYGRVAETGEPVRLEQESLALGRWFAVYAFRLGEAGSNKVAVLFSDISARRRAEGEAARLGAEGRARLAELETLLDVLPIGIGIALDRECRNIRLNPAFASVLGLPTDANASKTAPAGEQPANFRVVDDSGREVPGTELPMQIAAREGREVRNLELNIEHADGRVLRLLEYAAPLFDENGEPRGSVGAFIDITDRRRSEERQRFLLQLDDAVRPLSQPDEIVAAAARVLGEHLRVDRCAYATIEADEDTMNITGNYCRGVPSIVGRYTFTEFGEEVLRLMRADLPYVVTDIDAHEPHPADLAAYRATQIQAVICVPLHKGGKFVAAMAVHQKTPRKWTEDDVSLTLLVANRCWEALERVKVTRVLAESEERFRTLADNIAQLAWMADAEGYLFWYNRRWFEYTGTTFEEMQGWGWERVHEPQALARMLPGWRDALARGVPWEDTFPLRGADGEYRWFLSRAVPVRDAKGKVQRWFGTNTDVTEQRAAADALARAKEEAEAASRAKDEFLAALSHELRTPLTPVLLCAAALEEEPGLPEEVRAQLAMMRRNIELEARLIDDLLDVTRIARGKLALRLEECEADSLIGLALEILRDEVEAKALTIEMDLQARQTRFRGDPARVQQVFWNLLKNAVKYTPRGGRITVSSRNADNAIEVQVQDTGMGMASESLERIFLPFEQAGLANDHRFGGLGLGLSITKAIVEMHGGSISAESDGLDRGATLRVALPISTEFEAEPSGASMNPGIRGKDEVAEQSMRILLVEDHEPTLATLARLLARAGHQITPAATVKTALELAETTPFDVVISDVGLPDGTGIDLMRSLYARHGLRGVAVTGYGTEDDLRRTREAGFFAHLTKPVDLAQLRGILAQLVPQPAASEDRRT